MSEVTVAQLEDERKKQEAAVERAKVAERLANNPDFRSLILNYFCVEECARYARESANPLLEKEDRRDALAMAQAAGHFKRFMQLQMQLGERGEAMIRDIDEALEEARLEEAAA